MSLVPSSFAGQVRRLSRADALSRRSLLFLRWSCAGSTGVWRPPTRWGFTAHWAPLFRSSFLFSSASARSSRVSVAAGCHAGPQVSALAAAFCSVTAFSSAAGPDPRSVRSFILRCWPRCSSAGARLSAHGTTPASLRPVRTARAARSHPYRWRRSAASLFIAPAEIHERRAPSHRRLAGRYVRLHGRSIDGHVISRRRPL